MFGFHFAILFLQAGKLYRWYIVYTSKMRKHGKTNSPQTYQYCLEDYHGLAAIWHVGWPNLSWSLSKALLTFAPPQKTAICLKIFSAATLFEVFVYTCMCSRSVTVARQVATSPPSSPFLRCHWFLKPAGSAPGMATSHWAHLWIWSGLVEIEGWKKSNC